MFADLSDFDIFKARGNAHHVWVPVPRGRANKLDEKKAFFLMPNIQSSPRHFIRTGIDLANSLPVNVLNPAGLSNEMESEELSGDASAYSPFSCHCRGWYNVLEASSGGGHFDVSWGSQAGSSSSVGELPFERVTKINCQELG